MIPKPLLHRLDSGEDLANGRQLAEKGCSLSRQARFLGLLIFAR